MMGRVLPLAIVAAPRHRFLICIFHLEILEAKRGISQACPMCAVWGGHDIARTQDGPAHRAVRV